MSPILFKILVKYLDYRTVCLLKKPVGSIRLGREADTLQRQATAWRHCSGLEDWDRNNFMRFNSGKWKVLHRRIIPKGNAC